MCVWEVTMLYVVTRMHVISVSASGLTLCISAAMTVVGLLTETRMVKARRPVLRRKHTLSGRVGDKIGVCLWILALDERQVLALRLGGDLRRLPLGCLLVISGHLVVVLRGEE